MHSIKLFVILESQGSSVNLHGFALEGVRCYRDKDKKIPTQNNVDAV